MNGVAVAAMVALAFLIPLAVLVQQLAHERAIADAERLTAMVASVLVTGDQEAVEKVVAAAGQQGDRVAVHGVADQAIGTGQAGSADVSLAAQQPDASVVRVAGGLAYLQPVEVDDRVAVVEVHIPDQALSAGVRTAWWALGAVALGLVLGAAVVGDRLADRVVRPARALADAAGSLGNGDWEVRVQPSGPREVAEAGYAFNRMAERLETLHTTEREMVADLSHRLRTPLTGLRLDVEALEAASDPLVGAGADPYGPRSAPSEADRRRTAARVRQALATLEHEIDVLIRTTREAAGGPPLQEESSLPAGLCDATDVLADRMTFWSAVAADQDRPCEVFGTHEPAPVRVPPSELGAALDAVLGNAFRYTPQGTALEVAVSRHDGWVAVRVDDAGPGIANPDRALKRGASDRGSTGLGLDIARRVAQAGGGSVSVGTSSQLGGASVVMLFADADAPPPQPPSRRGLIGRLTREPRELFDRRERRERRRREAREPRGRGWPRQRRPFD